MSDIREKIYYDYSTNKKYTESEIKPLVFRNYEVEISRDIENTFLPFGLAARTLYIQDQRSLLCLSKSLHAYMAQTAERWVTPIPPQIVNLHLDAQFFMNFVETLKENEYLLATHILHDYIPLGNRNNQRHTPILTNFHFLSVSSYPGFVNFEPLLQKAPFLKGLTLRLTDANNLANFVTTYPSLFFIQELILSPTRIASRVRIHKEEINSYLPGVYSDEIVDSPGFFRSSTMKIARQRVLKAMKDDESMMKNKPHFLALLHKTPNLRKLVIDDDDVFAPDLEGLNPNSLPSLELLEIDSGLLTPRSIQLLLEAAPNLKELIIPKSDFYFDDLFLGLRPDSLPCLERIILPIGIEIADSFEAFGKFDSKNVEAIQAAAPKLTEMKTGGFKRERIVYIAPAQAPEVNPEV